MTDALHTIDDIDFLGLQPLKGKRAEDDFLAIEQARASARSLKGVPLSPEERFAEFRHCGFRPHGLYVPDDKIATRDLYHRMWNEIGVIPEQDARLSQYFALQNETAEWERQGIPGHWIGQQAVARCLKRFRITGWGRRAGKTEYAAHEAVAYLRRRPGCVVWIAARTLQAVGRCFDMVIHILKAIGEAIESERNSRDERYLILPNGSRCEGVSLHDIGDHDSAAGAGVAFTVVDEAAQVAGEAWTRAIEPPLSDYNGYALVLSSYRGEENWFYDQAEKALEGGDPDWAAFVLASWFNFFVHPRGRRSPALLTAERNANEPGDFLEQYGAVPQRTKHQVYPQYRDTVHLDHQPFDRTREVFLCGDPSAGANPYALGAMQKYPERAYQEHVVIDTIYLTGAITEDMANEVNRRPWRDNVVDMVIDGANPAEVERWARLGFPVWGMEDKPKGEARYPVVRRLLRDPLRYETFYWARMAEILADHGITLETYMLLEATEQRPYLIELEERLADARLTPEDIQALKECSHLVLNRDTTLPMQREFKHYAYEAARRAGQPRPERAKKWDDHLMDALAYYAWYWTRHEYYAGLESEPIQTSALRELGTSMLATMAQAADLSRGQPEDADTLADRGWLRSVRARHVSPYHPTNTMMRVI